MRRLGLEKRRALAPEAAAGAPGEELDPQQLEAVRPPPALRSRRGRGRRARPPCRASEWGWRRGEGQRGRG
eukprot:9662144-Alexandrium_andersonii.AAC.1